MRLFKEPSFQDRVANAAEAKKKALEALRSKPVKDPKVAADRAAARAKREADKAERRAANKAAQQSAKATEADAAVESVETESPTEAELKAARDARYAARKSRK